MVRDYFVEFYVDIAVFLKTQASGLKADSIIVKMGLDYSHRIEAQGYARGLRIY